MPSTVVHVAIAGLLAAALMGDEFDARSLAVVAAVTILPDLDAFVGLVVVGGHRAVLHTLIVPALLGAALLYDVRFRAESAVRDRWGVRGVRIAWVSLLAWVVAAIGPDLFTGGANVLYPVHDQFIRLDGSLELSNRRGLVQTFFDGARAGTTEEVHIRSGVDPNPGPEPENVERMFPIVRSGMQAIVVLTSALVVSIRLVETRRSE